MTRIEKIRRIQKYRPSLYMRLKKKVPNIVEAPNNSTAIEISIYNDLIKAEARNDSKNNLTFVKNFSF